MPDHDERELEQLFRDGLGELALEADTTRAVEPREAGRRWLVPLLAAGAVAASLAVAVPLALPDDDGPPGPGAPTTAPTDGPDAGDPTAGWRVESWHGAQVRVPPDWALGGSPVPDGGSAGLIDCGVGAYVDHQTRPGLPYVGRPRTMSDMCLVLDPDSLPAPTSSYVWFGSPMDPGDTAWDNGFAARTVEVGDQRVTVATDDAALRDQIVATVEETGPTDGNGCPAVQADRVEPEGVLTGTPQRLVVCVYEPGTQGWPLLWSTELGAGPAGEFAAAAGPTSDGRCKGGTGFDSSRVVLQVHGEAGGVSSTATYVVDFACSEIRLPPTDAASEPVVALTRATVEPWAGDGTRAYVIGPMGYDEALTPYFHGLMG